MGHARALAGIDDLAAQLDIYGQISSRNLSVRALENLIKNYNEDPAAAPTTAPVALPAEVVKIREQLSSSLGTKVEIRRSGTGKGQIIIRFADDRSFNDIVETLATIED